MIYKSLSNPKLTASFKEAATTGIAPDRGLYFPNHIPVLGKSFWSEYATMDKKELGFEVMKHFVGNDIDKDTLAEIAFSAIDFDLPVIRLDDHIGVLELFHGPTLAFKDVGARFMARCLGYFSAQNGEKTTVLVATSGDTGGAVADGFLGVSGVEVVILYPSGQVSPLQEKQLTALGQNIKAIEVLGSFDDCQEMVKTAFVDQQVRSTRKLTSANSINVARWLPQMLYYFVALQQKKSADNPWVISVPSGNFGNLCAGFVAQKLGLDVAHFIAATNSNKTVPDYLNSGVWTDRKSVATRSNAMDVAHPSNWIRIEALHNNDLQKLRSHISSFSFTDVQTMDAMQRMYDQYHYMADPHGAIGYLGLERYLQEKPNHFGVFLETAHPIKFTEVVNEALGFSPELPDGLQRLMHSEKKSTVIKNYDELKEVLMQKQ
ncbi:MAG: threonine synthase [Flavobacteriaceae bacterium]